jgi:hypothetical protein
LALFIPPVDEFSIFWPILIIILGFMLAADELQLFPHRLGTGAAVYAVAPLHDCKQMPDCDHVLRIVDRGFLFCMSLIVHSIFDRREAAEFICVRGFIFGSLNPYWQNNRSQLVEQCC